MTDAGSSRGASAGRPPPSSVPNGRRAALMRTPTSRSLWRALTLITEVSVIDLGQPEPAPLRQRARATHLPPLASLAPRPLSCLSLPG
jgi:hypothetical protein